MITRSISAETKTYEVNGETVATVWRSDEHEWILDTDATSIRGIRRFSSETDAESAAVALCKVVAAC